MFDFESRAPKPLSPKPYTKRRLAQMLPMEAAAAGHHHPGPVEGLPGSQRGTRGSSHFLADRHAIMRALLHFSLQSSHLNICYCHHAPCRSMPGTPPPGPSWSRPRRPQRPRCRPGAAGKRCRRLRQAADFDASPLRFMVRTLHCTP